MKSDKSGRNPEEIRKPDKFLEIEIIISNLLSKPTFYKEIWLEPLKYEDFGKVRKNPGKIQEKIQKKIRKPDKFPEKIYHI